MHPGQIQFRQKSPMFKKKRRLKSPCHKTLALIKEKIWAPKKKKMQGEWVDQSKSKIVETLKIWTLSYKLIVGQQLLCLDNMIMLISLINKPIQMKNRIILGHQRHSVSNSILKLKIQTMKIKIRKMMIKTGKIGQVKLFNKSINNQIICKLMTKLLIDLLKTVTASERSRLLLRFSNKM